MKNQVLTSCLSLYRFSVAEKLYIALRARLLDFTELEEHIPPEGKILDVGCGYGVLANYLAFEHPDREVHGIDIDEKRLNRASATIGSRTNIHFSLRSIENISFVGFDIILILDMLHYLPYETQEQILRSIASNLDPGGVLIFRTPDTQPLWRYSWNYLHEWFMVGTGLTRTIEGKLFFRSSASYRDLLSLLGFKVQTVPNQSLLPYSDMLYICTMTAEKV